MSMYSSLTAPSSLLDAAGDVSTESIATGDASGQELSGVGQEPSGMGQEGMGQASAAVAAAAVAQSEATVEQQQPTKADF